MATAGAVPKLGWAPIAPADEYASTFRIAGTLPPPWITAGGSIGNAARSTDTDRRGHSRPPQLGGPSGASSLPERRRSSTSDETAAGDGGAGARLPLSVGWTLPSSPDAFDPSRFGPRQDVLPGTLPERNGASAAASPTAHLDTAQAAQQITRNDFQWGTTLGQPSGPISFGFRTSGATYFVGGSDISNFSPFTSAEQNIARTALQFWADVANISFTDLGETNNATILFQNYRDFSDGAGAFAFLPNPAATGPNNRAGDVFINSAFTLINNDTPGTYTWLTFIHEIGHALGLEHPGDYNAAPGQSITYDNNAEYIEDTNQYTVMSYFSESFTGGSYGGIDAETPMLHDIAAIQRLYGINSTTRTEDDVYGFHSNLTGSVYSIGAASQRVVFTVWDCGGSDTFDFSGYSQSQTIDLNSERFSSVGGSTFNIAIAAGVAIENAVGGSGDDLIISNELPSSVLTGGAGSDVFRGTQGGMNANTITDFTIGDVLHLTDATADGFSFTFDGMTLRYGSSYQITFANQPTGFFSIAPDSAGGVDLRLQSQPPAAVLYDFVFKYNDYIANPDAGNYYFGTVADDGTYGYAVGQTIITAAGRYEITQNLGPTTRAVGSVNDYNYWDGAGSRQAYAPYYSQVTGLSGTVPPGGLGTDRDYIVDANGAYHYFDSGAEAIVNTPILFDFEFLYNDYLANPSAGSYYFGRVVDDGRYQYSVGQTITTSAGMYLITGNLGATDRPVGTVDDYWYFDGAGSQQGYIPYYHGVQGQSATVAPGGLGTDVDYIVDAAGNFHYFSSTTEAIVTTPRLFDFQFLYNDYLADPSVGDYYFGRVADDGRYQYSVGETIVTSAGQYLITRELGPTTQPAGTVDDYWYWDGASQQGFVPYYSGIQGHSGTVPPGGLGTDRDYVVGSNGQFHFFSSTTEAAI